LNDKLEQHQSEVLTWSVVSFQVEDKGINIDPVNIISKEEEESREVKTYAEVAVQTLDIPTDDAVTHSTTTMSEGNQESTTNMKRENQTKGAMYRHPNHKSRLSNQATYQYHSKNKQQIHVPKDTEACRIQSYDNYSPHISKDQKIPQKINLGWSDPFSVRQFCLSLRVSYRLISTKMKVQRWEDVLKLWGQSFLKGEAMLWI